MRNLLGNYRQNNGEAELYLSNATSDHKIEGNMINYNVKGRGITNQINFTGTYKTIKQRSDTFYLVTMQAIGTYNNERTQTNLPVAISFSGFMTEGSNNLLTQFSQAYEFFGNAEEVSGTLIAWMKTD